MARSGGKALIVIDVQNCFVTSSSRRVVPKIVRHVQRERTKFGLVVFTRFVNTKRSSVYRFLGWKKCLTVPENSFVSEIAEMLRYGAEIQKQTYSAFKSRKLKQFLQKEKIQKVVLCGMDTDCCVLATALDAFDLGYRVHILRNLTASSGGKKYHHFALPILWRTLTKVSRKQ